MLLLPFHAAPRTRPEEAVHGKGRILPTHPAASPPRTRRFDPNGRSPGGPAYPERFRRTGYQPIPSAGPWEPLRFPNLCGPRVPGSSSFRAREGLPKIVPAQGTDGSARRKSPVGRRTIRHAPEPPLLFSSSGERGRSTLKPDEPQFRFRHRISTGPLGTQAGCSWQIIREPVHSVSSSYQDGLY